MKRSEEQLNLFDQGVDRVSTSHFTRLPDFLCGECWLLTGSPAPTHGRCQDCEKVISGQRTATAT